jgi:hypothetical protein
VQAICTLLPTSTTCTPPLHISTANLRCTPPPHTTTAHLHYTHPLRTSTARLILHLHTQDFCSVWRVCGADGKHPASAGPLSKTVPGTFNEAGSPLACDCSSRG